MRKNWAYWKESNGERYQNRNWSSNPMRGWKSWGLLPEVENWGVCISGGEYLKGRCNKDRARLCSAVPNAEHKAAGTNPNAGGSLWTSGSTSGLYRWRSNGTGHPEVVESLPRDGQKLLDMMSGTSSVWAVGRTRKYLEVPSNLSHQVHEKQS